MYGAAYPHLGPAARANLRCLDDPPHPKLDLWRLYRCNQPIHQKPILFVSGPLSPQLNPVHPQIIVAKQRSPQLRGALAMKCLSIVFILIAATIVNAQFRWDTLTNVKDTDVAFATLQSWQSKTDDIYKKGGFAVATFSSWFALPFESLKTLFPEKLFYTINWSERPAPGKENESFGFAFGIGITLVCGKDGKLITEISPDGNHEAFGSLLRDSKVFIRSAEDAKLVWMAFCDIHQKNWQKYPALKIDDKTWHLGDAIINRFHYYYKVRLDDSYRVASAESHADELKKP